jgi:protein TonB
VNRWLATHLTYPEAARRLGIEGTVVLRITVDRDGYVQSASLARSSGSEMLDRAAQALLRAAHLPPFPPDMAGSVETLAVPIHYHLD